MVKLDAGETLTNAVKREVLEEVGISLPSDPEDLRIIGVSSGSTDWKTTLTVFFCYNQFEGDPNGITLSGEHSSYRWVSFAEARDMVEKGFTASGIKFLLTKQQPNLFYKVFPIYDFNTAKVSDSPSY